MIVDLAQMQQGQSGVVSDICGGQNLVRRLESMGIRPSRKITKVSSHFWHGPQTILLGRLQIAIGFGMAKKIMIQVEG